MGADQRRARGWNAKARGNVIFAGDVKEKECTGRKKPVEVFFGHLWGNERGRRSNPALGTEEKVRLCPTIFLYSSGPRSLGGDRGGGGR